MQTATHFEASTSATLNKRRWPKHTPHRLQSEFYRSRKRFIVCPAGRRSGKTAIAKRKALKRALLGADNGWYIWGAPTYAQAKRIFWRDLKKMSRPFLLEGTKPNETSLEVTLYNGARITVMGMEAPERAEGAEMLCGILLDEYANMKEDVWDAHLSPALSDISLPKPGWCIFIGVPEGRNHYFDLWQFANDPENADEWVGFTWHSSEVLDPKEIASARKRMDARLFRQEYEGDFVTMEGRIYYGFDRKLHIDKSLRYDPRLPLIVCLDFNVAPGSAVICQIQDYHGDREDVAKQIVVVLSEVHQAQDSTTPEVCREILDKWGHHTKEVIIYGDASGGNKGTAKTDGSDWTLVKKTFATRWIASGRMRGSGQLRFRVPKSNPAIRDRVNAVNTHLQAADGTISTLVHPSCKELIRDFEGVLAVKGSGGEIDKKNLKRTHWTDGFGYFIHRAFPLKVNKTTSRAA